MFKCSIGIRVCISPCISVVNSGIFLLCPISHKLCVEKKYTVKVASLSAKSVSDVCHGPNQTNTFYVPTRGIT